MADQESRPPVPTETRVVDPDWRSRTRTSGRSLASPATRLDAFEEKATYRPSALIRAANESSLAGPPPGESETRRVWAPSAVGVGGGASGASDRWIAEV